MTDQPSKLSHFIDVDSIRTHYLEAGSGPTLVLLHSGEFGGCAELSWEFVIDDLAKHFRVVAPDWLGFGRTDKVHDFAQGVARRIRHMQRFVEVMGLGPAHFGGNSMGGTILAQAMAENASAFPARSLTLISSGGFMPDNEYRRRLVSYDCTRESMRGILEAVFHDPKWAADEAYIDRRVELSLIPGAWECAAASRFKSPAVQPRPDFGKADTIPYEAIAVPTLVIAGGDDRLRLPGYAPELGARIPSSQVHVLDGCGHCPNIEQPAMVVRLMVAFIEAVESGAATAKTGTEAQHALT